MRLQQVLNADETTVRVAISLLERADLLTRGFDVALEARVKLPPTLSAAARADLEFRAFVRSTLLRPGKEFALRIADVAADLSISHVELERRLIAWRTAGWLLVKLSRRALAIDLPPTPPDMLERIHRLLEQSRALGQRRIDDMVGYATTEGCRHGNISAHFGSPPRIRCTVCDNCTGERPNLPTVVTVNHLLPDDADIAPMIIDTLISLPRPLGRSGLAKVLVGHLRASVTPDKARHHGALKALGESSVQAYVDDLIESGRLRQYERQGFLVLAPTLAGRAEAEAWRDQHPELSAYGEAPLADEEEGSAEPDKADPGAAFTPLQKALWHWRRRLAADLGQPPYVVMTNELMLQIAEARPRSLEELGALRGMGAQRLEHYGPTILDLVRLTPHGEGDDVLLAAQREALTAAKATAKSNVAYAKAQAVSPAMQRKIQMKLEEIRQRVAVSGRSRMGEVAPTALLKEIAASAPATLEELEAIPGFRSSGLRSEAPQIITFITALRSAEERA
jgi:ATP-dependent DNA helicase RecQ